MLSIRDERKREYMIYGLAVLFIGAWCCRNIGKMDHIVLMNDEFGYWSNAVSMAGYDWKDLIAETPYYSWGYSIWLIPIILFLPTPELWYRAAIILNAMFLIGSYFLCVSCGKRLFPYVSKVLIGISSLIVIIYPGNITYAQATWSETLLYMLMWVEIYLLIKLEDKFSARTYVAAILTLVYTYVVHARGIGLIIAGILCLILILLKHKKKISYILLLIGLVALVALGYLGNELMKNYLVVALWGNSQLSVVNNVSLNTTSISKYISRFTEQLNCLLSSLGGKYIYLLIGTGLTLPVAVIQICREYISNFKEKNFFANYSISKGYSVSAMALMWGVCSLQINVWAGRKDFIVYGRYMENALGPLLLIGIMYVITMGRESRIGILIAGISILLGLIPVYKCVEAAAGQFSTICSPVIGAFCDMAGDETRAFIFLGIVVLSLMAILYVSTFFSRAMVRGGIILASFTVIFIIMGYYGGNHLLWGRNFYDGIMVPLSEKITVDYGDREIYYIKNVNVDSTSTNPKYLQFLIPDRAIHVIAEEEAKQMLGQEVLIMINSDDEDLAGFLEDSGKVKKFDSSILLTAYATKSRDKE